MPRKDVAFKLRIEEELRRSFLEACRVTDRPAAQVVREFMRQYIARHPQQASLFSDSNGHRNDADG